MYNAKEMKGALFVFSVVNQHARATRQHQNRTLHEQRERNGPRSQTSSEECCYTTHIKHYKTQKYSLIYIHMYTYTYMYTYIRIYTCTYYRHRDMDLGMKLRMYVRTYFSLCPCSMDACTVRDACTFVMCNIFSVCVYVCIDIVLICVHQDCVCLCILCVYIYIYM